MFTHLKSGICCCMFLLFCAGISQPAAASFTPRQFYQLQVYQIKDHTQEKEMDRFLAQAYIPAAHRAGLSHVGIFKTLGIDTARIKKIYILTAFRSLDEFLKINQKLEQDNKLLQQGTDFINAAYNEPAFLRKEVILMEAFAGMPVWRKPDPLPLGPQQDRIYELRNYESSSDKLYRNKVQMFNELEMEIFERIGSQPVFYGEVIAGSRMPNLMYLTVYADRKSREAHWKIFSADPAWKRISALPEYQNNVAVVDVTLLSQASYSDL